MKEKCFSQKVPDDCVYPMGRKFYRNLPISNVTEINMFLHFTQKFKVAAKMEENCFFWDKVPYDSAHILWVENFIEIALSWAIPRCVFPF